MLPQSTNPPHPRFHEFTCDQCGKFVSVKWNKSHNGRMHYCSDACYRIVTASATRECLICGKSFRVHPSAIERGWGKYCSRECKFRSYEDRYHVSVTCERCGKPLRLLLAVSKRSPRHFCSRQCAQLTLTPRTMMSLICQICGKTFERWPAQVKKDGGKYCSNACKGVGLRGSNGSDSYRGVHWATIIRPQILERDGFRCTQCGSAKRLHVHHIISWDTSHDNSTENLRTLCFSCHGRIHRPHRKKPDTAERRVNQLILPFGRC